MALGVFGKSRYGHTLAWVCCDECVAEGHGAQPLHKTLYKTEYRKEGAVAYLCEVHAIGAGLREPVK